MKLNRLTIAAVLCITLCHAAEKEAGKLFVGVSYQYKIRESTVPGDFLGWWKETKTESSEETISTGTYWCVKSPDNPSQKIYISAAHVFHLNLTPTKIDGKKVDGEDLKLEGKTTRPVMSTLGYEVGKIGTVDGVVDAAFFLPKKTNIKCNLSEWELAESLPGKDEKVKLLGFHSSPTQQTKEALVTDVHAAQGYFTLNTVVDSGFSGGPVYNSEGKVYGLISSTDKAANQTTVIIINRKSLGEITWKGAE